MKFRLFLALAAGLLFGLTATAADNVVEIGSMKSKAPAAWKEEKSNSQFRLTQFKLPKAEGDPDDAELAVFFFQNPAGSVEENLKRQVDVFQPGEGEKEVKSKVGKIKVGALEVPYQDLQGTYRDKKGKGPFDPNAKVTLRRDYRQLYVIIKPEQGQGEYYMKLLGPVKTVEKHKNDFEDFLKNFK
jgi:hypothetical protein